MICSKVNESLTRRSADSQISFEIMPENQSTRLTFLGTGGGRFATMYQTRATGGIYLADNIKLHLDPGPSALHNMKCAAIDPAKTDGLLLSHCHPDHYSDAEVLVEGMSKGGIVKRGALIGSERLSTAMSCLKTTASSPSAPVQKRLIRSLTLKAILFCPV